MCWYEHTHTHIYICVYIVQLCIWCYIYIIYNIWCYIYIHSCTIYTYIYKTPDTQLHNCILLKCTWKNWVKGPLLPDSSHLFIFFWWDWGLNSRLHTCKACFLPLEPQLQFVLLWLFCRWGLLNYLPGLALNSDFPSLSLPSSQDYRHLPLVPSQTAHFS
jgi:hypothetical protein